MIFLSAITRVPLLPCTWLSLSQPRSLQPPFTGPRWCPGDSPQLSLSLAGSIRPLAAGMSECAKGTTMVFRARSMLVLVILPPPGTSSAGPLATPRPLLTA